MAQVVDLRSDALKGQAPEQQKQFFQGALSPSVALAAAEKNVKLAVVAGLQLKLVAGEYFQSIDTGFGSQQIGQAQNAGRRENHGAIEQGGIHFRRGLASYFNNLWLAYAIPVLQRSRDVPLQKIDGAKKIIAIRIRGIETQGPPQVARRGRISLLPECHARQFQRKPLVIRLQPRSGGESPLGVLPSTFLGQCRAVIEIEISRRGAG